MKRGWICAAFLAAALSGAGEAQADQIRQLTHRLARSPSGKVRISAALSLAKSRDSRAVRALVRSLRSDHDPAIRRISAASLGQHLQAGMSGSVRKEAVVALGAASKKDRDGNVRSSARVALSKSSLAPQASQKRRKGPLLVDVKPARVQTRGVSRRNSIAVQSAISSVIVEKSPRSVRLAPASGGPKRGTSKASFSLVPSVTKLSTSRKGRNIILSCEVTMHLSPMTQSGGSLQAKDTATVKGKGSVLAGKSRAALQRASKSCLEAVSAQVTANQVVPFLARKSR